MPVRRIRLVGEVGPRSSMTRGSSGPMCLLNSFSPLLLRCERAPDLAAVGAAPDLENPRRNLRKSGATLLLYKKYRNESRVFGPKKSGAAAPDRFTKRGQFLGSNER